MRLPAVLLGAITCTLRTHLVVAISFTNTGAPVGLVRSDTSEQPEEASMLSSAVPLLKRMRAALLARSEHHTDGNLSLTAELAHPQAPLPHQLLEEVEVGPTLLKGNITVFGTETFSTTGAAVLAHAFTTLNALAGNSGQQPLPVTRVEPSDERLELSRIQMHGSEGDTDVRTVEHKVLNNSSEMLERNIADLNNALEEMLPTTVAPRMQGMSSASHLAVPPPINRSAVAKPEAAAAMSPRDRSTTGSVSYASLTDASNPNMPLIEPSTSASWGGRSVVRRVVPPTESPWTSAIVYPPGSWGTELPFNAADPSRQHHATKVTSRPKRPPDIGPGLAIGLLILGALILVILGLGIQSAKVCNPAPRPRTSEVRSWVESLHVRTQREIEEAFKPRGGYDCLHLQPQSLGVAMRVQGRVVVAPQATLRAPITKRRCVLFSSSATEHRLDGVIAPPAAFDSMAVNFAVELDEGLRINVHGQDVALFDLTSGRHEERVPLGEAPDALQDFVRAHRAPFTGGGPSNSAVLEFQESVLEVGARVTCVGEVRRSETGEMVLCPSWRDPYGVGAGATPGLTSWERSGTEATRIEKVVISDDVGLLE